MLLKEEKLDPRVRRTRQLIKDAFVSLLKEKGFQSVTVQDITDNAGINRATFYAHYVDKYELQEHLVIEWFEETLENYVSSTDSFCRESMKQLVMGVCAFLKGLNSACHPSDMEFKPILESQIQGHLYNIILDWLNSHQPATKNIEITASAISWTIFGTALHWSKNQSQFSPETVAEQVLEFIEIGLIGISDAATN